MPRRHHSSSPLLSLPVLIILLPIITSLFLFYTIPPILSLTSQILRPTISVKKSWDSLNVFLVIFAILCGIFAKRNDDGSPAEEEHIQNAPHPLNNIPPLNTTNTSESSQSVESSVVFTQQWFGYSERSQSTKIYEPSINITPSVRAPESGGGSRMRRSSSSYPDLRQAESLWEARDHSMSQFRFFDDFGINTYNRPPPKSRESRSKEYSDVIKEIPVDTFVLRSSPPRPQSPAPPPPPPPPPRHQNAGRTYQSVGRKDQKTEKVVSGNDAEEFETGPPTPPPPPPPRPAAPPSPMRIRSEPKRRKSNVKREIAMVWASVLSTNQRKRKKKQKATSTRDIYDSATHDSPPQRGGDEEYYFTRPPPSRPPPPPPPPPPYSVFHSLFKKGMSKTKKVHSVSTPPAPPPPPPRPTSLQKLKSWSTSFPTTPPTPPQQPPPGASRRRSSTSSGRPPLPTKVNSYLSEENVNSGCQSPLIPVAPPPPPFKMPELRFSLRGDFVKIRSGQSSRSGSPELEESEALPGKEEEEDHSESQRKVNVMNSGDGGGGGGGGSVFCPSPDVNTKADNFIARLRDEWRLEKMNSVKRKMA